ncbi:uncharacterized protein LOC107626842 [Arachis ipaensis]|uniref:uncharacterized protein LOC107626842 n=1 Tax=Arachis ipaensis TaxID=130454 RepID=UPI0007AF7485|nr:uncharacterized protein LOC107626842 [Arachis ipaensis]
MVQPEGYSFGTNLVCKLEKALYSLKQAPHAWFLKLKGILKGFGVTSTTFDPCLFVKYSSLSIIYLLTYVNDILVTGTAVSEVNKLIVDLNKVFTLKNSRKMSFFLDIEAERSATGSLVLKLSKYVRDLLMRVDIVGARPMSTPMMRSLKLDTSGAVFDNLSLYHSMVGGLQYVTITRLDITFAVNKVSQFFHTPLEQYWKTVKHILRYLARTIDMGLEFHKSKNFRILAFCDSDGIANPVDRKSHRDTMCF